MIAELVVMRIGPAIAKSMLKMWLKDSDLAVGVGNSFVDILSQSGMDVVHRRQVARRFEEISDKVATSLQPLFQDGGLPDNEREAVILAVAETLADPNINAATLAQHTFDSESFGRWLQDARPEATNLISGAGTDLYRRILSESAHSIINIAQELPRFQLNAFREVLSRIDALSEQVERILETTRREQEHADRKTNDFERAYRRVIADELDHVDLFGIDISRPSFKQALKK